MALSSQSSRSSLRSNSSPSSSSKRGNATFLLVSGFSFAAIFGTAWLLRAAGDSTGGTSFVQTAEAAPVNIVPVGTESRRTALDNALDIVTAASSTTASVANQPVAVEPTVQAAPETPKPETPKPEATKPEATKPETPTQEQKPADTATEPKPERSEPFFGNGFNGAAPAQQDGAAAANSAITEGLGLAASDPVKARALLSKAVLTGSLDEPTTRSAVHALAQINAKLFMTPVFNAGDTSCFQYTVAPNDSLEKIVRKNKIGCDWRLVARMNNIKKPESIQVGKRLKLPKGPFSAVVSKRDYRIDVCIGEGADRVIVASMPVGLGQANGTPVGMFRVKPGSKLLNPDWIHPVTGQRFDGDDAANPIGEHWMGLEGVDAANAKLQGYGIHGTIEPDSIGHDQSLGCVRLLADDVAIVWECLGDGAPVEIR